MQTKTYQELKKEILKELLRLNGEKFHFLSGEFDEVVNFVSAKLDEVASAALAAGEVEDKPDGRYGHIGNDVDKIYKVGKDYGWNAAIAESKRRSDEWLGKNN